MQRLRLVMLVGAWLAIGLPTVAVADDMTALVRDYDAFARLLDPVRAGERGDATALRRWPDDSPAALTERRKTLQGFKTRLDGLAGAALGTDDVLNRNLLSDRVGVALAGLEFDAERIPFIDGDGFYTVPDYAALNTVLKTEADADAWLARLAAIPGY